MGRVWQADRKGRLIGLMVCVLAPAHEVDDVVAGGFEAGPDDGAGDLLLKLPECGQGHLDLVLGRHGDLL
jgi:hypothetical protein